MQLTMLTPGSRTNNVSDSPTLATSAGSFQLNLDGQQVTQLIAQTGYGQPRFSGDAIQEFQFVTSRFDATQGRSSGAQINAVTKSGTNLFSGTLSGSFRSDKFNAEDFIVHQVLPYSDQQISGTFGGPIVQNKAHFFGYYEGERNPQSFTFTSPYPAFNIDPLVGTTIVPRNNFVGEPLHRVDLRILRHFALGGRAKVDGIIEFFNLFNHANYSSYVTTENSAAYSQPVQNVTVEYQPRMMQLGFRFVF
jgi:hypothetical protein